MIHLLIYLIHMIFIWWSIWWSTWWSIWWTTWWNTWWSGIVLDEPQILGTCNGCFGSRLLFPCHPNHGKVSSNNCHFLQIFYSQRFVNIVTNVSFFPCHPIMDRSFEIIVIQNLTIIICESRIWDICVFPVCPSIWTCERGRVLQHGCTWVFRLVLRLGFCLVFRLVLVSAWCKYFHNLELLHILVFEWIFERFVCR